MKTPPCCEADRIRWLNEREAAARHEGIIMAGPSPSRLARLMSEDEQRIMAEQERLEKRKTA
jgi:hypothetical protein